METVRFLGGTSPDSHSGVDVTYYRNKRKLVIGGWYDDMVGIESTSIDLREFLKVVGVTQTALRKALKEWDDPFVNKPSVQVDGHNE